MTLGTPAAISDRNSPITPSPVILPLPVLQALRTTRSAVNLRSNISLTVRSPLLNS
jgi:hypothetical protein